MILHEPSLPDLYILSVFIGTVNATKIKLVTFHETFTCAEKYFKKYNIFKMQHHMVKHPFYMVYQKQPSLN